MTNTLLKAIDIEIRKFNNVFTSKEPAEIDKSCRALLSYAMSVDSEPVEVGGKTFDAIVVEVAAINTSLSIEKVNNVEYEKLHEDSLVLLVTDTVEWALYSGDAYFEPASDELSFKKNCKYQKTSLEELAKNKQYRF